MSCQILLSWSDISTLFGHSCQIFSLNCRSLIYVEFLKKICTLDANSRRAVVCVQWQFDANSRRAVVCVQWQFDANSRRAVVNVLRSYSRLYLTNLIINLTLKSLSYWFKSCKHSFKLQRYCDKGNKLREIPRQQHHCSL